MRESVNAKFCVLRGGIPWQVLPGRFPLRQTVYRWFNRFYDRGVWKSITLHLVMRERRAVVATAARPLVLQRHAASIQDRDDAALLLQASRGGFPSAISRRCTVSSKNSVPRS